MKHLLKKTLQIECTLDSSEAVMFTKGGKHTLRIKELDDDEDYINFNAFHVVEISFQIEKSQQGRFDHIDLEAKKHREQWDNINKEESIRLKTSEESSTPSS